MTSLLRTSNRVVCRKNRHWVRPRKVGSKPARVHKRKYATVEREITTVTTESEPHVPDTEDFPFGAITEILTGEDVPIDVTEAVGDLIYQYFA